MVRERFKMEDTANMTIAALRRRTEKWLLAVLKGHSQWLGAPLLVPEERFS